MKHHIIFLSVLILIFTISCQSLRNVTSPQDAENYIKQSNYINIKIAEGNPFTTGPCEPAIAINPTNPKNIVAGSVLDNYYYSFDGGNTWIMQESNTTNDLYDISLAPDGGLWIIGEWGIILKHKSVRQPS